ncbi:hypothetical protein ACLX1H_010868 [Fusarium chlamydosporum]
MPLLAWDLTGDACNTSTVTKLSRPARVHGYARFAVRHYDYPAIVKHESGEVDGNLIVLETQSQRRKLDDFEGESYQVTAVKATLKDGSVVDADLYLWDDDPEKVSDEPWDLREFVKERLEDWLDLFQGMEL